MAFDRSSLRYLKLAFSAAIFLAATLGHGFQAAPPAGVTPPGVIPEGTTGVQPVPSEDLRALLAEIQGLSDIQIDADGPLLVVSGTADDPAAIEAADAAIASVGDPAHYRNQIELSTDFNDRVQGAAGRVGAKAQRILAYLPLVPFALGVLLLAFVLAWLVGKLDGLFARVIANPFLGGIAQRAVQIAVLLAGTLVALEILDAVALIGGVLGAAGVVGLAIGFAFKDLVENYIASILLSLRQPFRPKDHVLIDGHEGLVTSMNTRTTVLTTFDGNIVRIPNAVVFKTTLTNYSTDPRRRFTFSVGIGYDVDLNLAIHTGIQVLASTEGVLQDPDPVGLITQLGDSSITLQLCGWVDQHHHDFLKVRSLAMQRVKARFDELDIDMPEPMYKIKVTADQSPLTLTTAQPEPKPQAKAAPEPRTRPSEEAPHATAPDRTVIEMAEPDDAAQDLLDASARTE